MKTKSQAASDLDNMLGSLQLDMNKQGVDTSAKVRRIIRIKGRGGEGRRGHFIHVQ